jgi:hypothetical protein
MLIYILLIIEHLKIKSCGSKMLSFKSYLGRYMWLPQRYKRLTITMIIIILHFKFTFVFQLLIPKLFN